MVDIINEKQDLTLVPTYFDLYDLLKVAEHPLGQKFKPQNEEDLKRLVDRRWDRQLSENKSQLFFNSQTVPALHSMGYTDLQERIKLDNFFVPLYSPSQ